MTPWNNIIMWYVIKNSIKLYYSILKKTEMIKQKLKYNNYSNKNIIMW